MIFSLFYSKFKAFTEKVPILIVPPAETQKIVSPTEGIHSIALSSLYQDTFREKIKKNRAYTKV